MHDTFGNKLKCKTGMMFDQKMVLDETWKNLHHPEVDMQYIYFTWNHKCQPQDGQVEKPGASKSLKGTF